MPVFGFHLRRRMVVEPDEVGIEFDDLHQAYLQACAAIPDTARDLLIAGEDPMICAYIIYDEKGRRLMEAPFTEILSLSEWRARRETRAPHGGVRSGQSRDGLALASFARIYHAVPIASAGRCPWAGERRAAGPDDPAAAGRHAAQHQSDV